MVKHPQDYIEACAAAGAAYITPHTDCIEGDAFCDDQQDYLSGMQSRDCHEPGSSFRGDSILPSPSVESKRL